MKRLLSTTVLLTLPQPMRPECPRIQSLFPGDQSVALQPVPAVATMGSQPISRATSASASFRLASVTNVSSSCEYTVRGAGELSSKRLTLQHPSLRERRRVMAAQVALRRQQEAQLKRHLAQGLMKGATPLKAPLRVKKGAIRPGVPCECLWLGVGQGFGCRKLRTSISVLVFPLSGPHILQL